MVLGKPIVLNLVLGRPIEYFSKKFFEQYDVRLNPYNRGLSKQELIKEIIDVEATIAAVETYDREVYEAAKKLKIVARYGVGYDSVNVNEATKFGIFATNLPGINAETVAEHAVSLMFAMVRGIVEQAKSTRPETWSKVSGKFYSDLTPFELYGKTLGIVGIGAIGSRVAKICSGLDLKIIAYDPYISSQKAMDLGVQLVSLDRLMAESDIVSIHSPLTEKTRHMIGEKQLKMMKRTAILVNAARGPVVDEHALYKALEEKKIFGACLDVLEKEPPEPDNPLFKLDNVIITPHTAGSSIENFMRCDSLLELQIEQTLRGEIPKFALNPEAIKYRK